MAVTGMGGLGKSTLAAKYYSIADQNDIYEVYLWFIAKDTDQLIQDYTRFLKEKGLNFDSTNDGSVVNALKTYLRKKKYLLVLDNVKFLHAIQEHIPEGNGHTVVTSRVHDSDWEELALDVFSEEEALSLLFKVSGKERIGEIEKEAKALVKKLGYLPLALEQAGKYIQRKKISIGEYRKKYKTKAKELLAYKEKKPRQKGKESDGRDTVYTTFELARDELDPLSQELMRYFSYFAPDNIPVFLFSGLKVEGAKLGLEESVEELEDYSLLNRSEDNHFVSLHRLVQKVSRLRQKELEGDEGTQQTIIKITKFFLSLEARLLEMKYKEARELIRFIECIFQIAKFRKHLKNAEVEENLIVEKFKDLFFALINHFYYNISSLLLLSPTSRDTSKLVIEHFAQHETLIMSNNVEWRPLVAFLPLQTGIPIVIRSALMLYCGFKNELEAYEGWANAAEDGKLDAFFVLGHYYLSGNRVLNKIHMAMESFRIAAEGGHARAREIWIKTYAAGINFVRSQKKQNRENSMLRLICKFEIKNPIAAEDIIKKKLDLSAYVKLHVATGLEYFREAALRNDSFGQLCLGKMFKKGLGVGKNKKIAMEWFQKAADQEDSEAQYEFGYGYYRGKGVEQSDKKAAEWYEKAAKNGNKLARSGLSSIRRKEYRIESEERLKNAAEQGGADAQYKMGEKYAIYKNKQSQLEAVVWFSKAAEQGHADAQFELGRLQLINKDVEESYDKAFYWFKKAAKRNHVVAQWNLFVMYSNGQGVEKNDKKAAEWCQKAAAQGYADAQFNIGVMYDVGRGVEQSDKKAAEWYEKAANQGHSSAQNNLGAMYSEGRGVKGSDDKAVEFYIKAHE